MELSAILAEPWIGTGRSSIPLTPSPIECPSRRFLARIPGHQKANQSESQEEPTLFVELMPLLKQRTLLITVARIDEKLKVNVIPAKAKEGEDEALSTPLSYTGLPEELDRELGQHLASYVDSHLALCSTLAEAKAEMDAAAKAARQKAKTVQQISKPDTGTKKEENSTPVVAPPDTTPSLFSTQTRTEKPGAETSAPERSTP